MKLVYSDHPRDQQTGPYTQVVFISRFNNMESISFGDLQNVVFIGRWSLYIGGLRRRFHCTHFLGHVCGKSRSPKLVLSKKKTIFLIDTLKFTSRIDLCVEADQLILYIH